MTSALEAITLQRTMPASAATPSAPAGVSVLTSAGPTAKNTTTSASTASDQRTPRATARRAAPAGVGVLTSAGPTAKNPTTSASAASDQRMLPVAALIPAASS